MAFSGIYPVSREQYLVYCDADYRPAVVYSASEKKYIVALLDSSGDLAFALSFVQRQSAARQREVKTHASFPVSTLDALAICEAYFKIVD